MLKVRKNGLYLRLSIADGDLGKDNKDESNSIDNQRTLLVNFVQDRDDLSDEYIEYVDDGYSGTNFERPAFKRMIEDAKTGKIDTIIVKTQGFIDGNIFTIWQRLYWCRRLPGASTSNTGNPFYLIKQ